MLTNRSMFVVLFARERARVLPAAMCLIAAVSGSCGGDDSSSPQGMVEAGIEAGTIEAETDAPAAVDRAEPRDGTPDASVAEAGDAAPSEEGAAALVLPGPGRGSAVRLSSDDAHLVAANRDADSVTVFTVNYPSGGPPQFVKKTDLTNICREPWQVAILPDNDTALVVCRRDQKVVRIKGLSTTPAKDGEAKVGSEPTGVALSPTGKTAWITAWADGVLNAIDTATMVPSGTVDLNAVLVAGGYLGAGIASRPALAHPRSLVITNNLDVRDDDETAYVTEYFSQQKQALTTDGQNADTARTGVVYKVALATKTASIIELPALADMGFRDHLAGQTGCFPNQVQSIDISGSFAYVVSVCASPKGPVGVFTGPAAKACAADDSMCPGQVVGSCVDSKCTTNCEQNADCGANGGKCTANKCETNVANVRTLSAPVVSVISLAAGATVATSSLNAAFFAMYETRATPDTAARRYPHLANDLAFVPGSNIAYLTANAADGAFRVVFGANAAAQAIESVGSTENAFIDLKPTTVGAEQSGRLPLGIAITNAAGLGGGQRYGFVLNENTRNVQVLDLTKNEITGASAGQPVVATTSPLPTDAQAKDVREGKRLFSTGLDRWSLNGQAWSSCQTCHVDGLTDNVTWFFPKGARQAISLDGTFAKGDATNVRIASWTAAVDEISDLESVLRNTNGGVGAIVSNEALVPASRIAFDKIGVGHGGLSGSSMAIADPSNPTGLAAPSVLADWKQVVAYITTIRSPRAPATLNADDVAAGQALFSVGNCQGCHSGPKWTISRRFYTPDPNNVVNGALKTLSWEAAVTTAGFPVTLLPASSSAAETMRYNGTNVAGLDQLTCALRNVGTFGQAEPGVGVAELRQDMSTPSQGNEVDGRGYNIPSLSGVAVGAPYFHAGNARTLEALVSDSFGVHRNAFTPGFLDGATADRATKVRQLVQFLLSIDADASPIAVPALTATGGVICAAP